MSKSITITIPSFKAPQLNALRSKTQVLASKAIDKAFDAAATLQLEIERRNAAAKIRVTK